MGRIVRGMRLFPGHLDPGRQAALLAEVQAVLAAAPPVRFATRYGRRLSVAMASAGPLGWVSDSRGYRYEAVNPATGLPWPPMPATARAVWAEVAGTTAAPDCCLINLYGPGARLGLHQDRDEADFGQPVVSISLGDEALFRIGGTNRTDPTESLWLHSGDVAVLEGASRLAFHGIDRIRAGSSALVPGGGRINLTLRVVT